MLTGFEPEFVITATYLGAAYTAAALFQLIFLTRAIASSKTAGSVLGYFLMGTAVGLIVFYLTLLFLPQVWPIDPSTVGGG